MPFIGFGTGTLYAGMIIYRKIGVVFKQGVKVPYKSVLLVIKSGRHSYHRKSIQILQEGVDISSCWQLTLQV